MNKTNKEEISKKIIEYRDKGKSCSQSVLIATCTNQDVPLNEKELLSLAKGFSGGIGGTFDEGTCGALTGAILALGLLLPEDEEKNIVTSKQLLKFFKEKYGTLQCTKLTDGGKDKSHCNDYCVFVGETFSNLSNMLL